MRKSTFFPYYLHPRTGHNPAGWMTQILKLLQLAPDIQEQLLFLHRVMSGKDPIHEKMLRPIAAEVDWGRQREMRAELSTA